MTRPGLPLLVLAIALAGCATGQQQSPRHGTTNSGINGVILAGPACPVQQEPPAASCAELPVQATVVVRSVRTGATVATVDATAGGRFSVTVEPGQYELTAKHDRGVPLLVEVPPNTWVEATVSIDTGIR
jgi:hypothetical protein